MLKKLILGILAALLIACAYIFFFSKDFTVNISEAQAQSALDRQLAKRPVGSFGVEINVTKAVIDFRDNDTAFISTVFSANALGYKGQVTGEFQSGMRFTPPRIYLNNIKPVIVNVQTDNDTKSELSEIKSAARKLLERQRDNSKSKSNEEFLNQVIGETSDDFQETIVNASYAFFENIPLYNLDNAGYKGSIASLALKDVVFSEDYATITLSPKQALIKILMMIAGFLLSLILLWFRFVPFSVTEKILGLEKSNNS